MKFYKKNDQKINFLYKNRFLDLKKPEKTWKNLEKLRSFLANESATRDIKSKANLEVSRPKIWASKV